MGTKERNFRPLPEDISLEDLVPKDNFYRRLQERLELSFVRELVEDLYAVSGRPSVDPEVFFRLQLVMFHEGIRSERELMRIVSDRLSVRWYVGYDLFESLPDHSSLTRIRDRFGPPVFREFFERIIEECAEAGLLWASTIPPMTRTCVQPDRHCAPFPITPPASSPSTRPMALPARHVLYAPNARPARMAGRSYATTMRATWIGSRATVAPSRLREGAAQTPSMGGAVVR